MLLGQPSASCPLLAECVVTAASVTISLLHVVDVVVVCMHDHSELLMPVLTTEAAFLSSVLLMRVRINDGYISAVGNVSFDSAKDVPWP